MKRPQQRKSGGARQKIWNALRRRKTAVTISELAELSGSTASQIRGFLAVLKDHGYLDWTIKYERAPVQVTLINNTGPRCPSVSIEKKTVHDWNLNPPMSRSDLRKVWKETGLSLSAFGDALGLGRNHGTKIKQMIDGSRPVSPAVEAAAKALLNR